MTDTLTLTLKKEWFDLIRQGKKIYEYREHKPHWIKRLTENGGSIRNFKHIHFINGYGKTRPFIKIECLGSGLISGKYIKPDNHEPIDINKAYFTLLLGKITEEGNIQ